MSSCPQATTLKQTIKNIVMATHQESIYNVPLFSLDNNEWKFADLFRDQLPIRFKR